jgi:3-deoxy-D-manno-octulosonate 8-phosphate phosphatase (KDO 8-P phosphatase)
VLEPLVARRIRLVGLDVDGVLTDGGIYVGAMEGQSVELKRFDTQDGIGILLLRAAQVKVVLVSGRVSDATRIRAEDVGVDEVVQDDLARKLPAFEQILTREDVTFEQAAFMGDDLPDLPLLARVALPVAVSNAVPEVRKLAHYTTDAPGGRGAVREFAETLLKARGEWDGLVERYLAERGETSRRVSRAY